jgi:hypothetical protein
MRAFLACAAAQRFGLEIGQIEGRCGSGRLVGVGRKWRACANRHGGQWRPIPARLLRVAARLS